MAELERSEEQPTEESTMFHPSEVELAATTQQILSDVRLLAGSELDAAREMEHVGDDVSCKDAHGRGGWVPAGVSNT